MEANPTPPGLLPQPLGGSGGPEATSWRDLECPGCGRTIKFRATDNVSTEWEHLPDEARYVGHVVALGWNYIYESDTGHGGEGREVFRPPGWQVTPSDTPQRVGLFHNCGLDWGDGGTSSDREPLSPAPPPRAQSLERDLPESH